MQIVSLAEVSNAQVADWLVDLADDLRPADLDEIAATTAEDPATSLITSVMMSTHAWVILDGEDPICAFGAAPDGRPGLGVVWMMGSPRMDEPRNALGILRQSRPYLDRLHAAYPTLWNNIDARNGRSMRWLEWLGFEVQEALPDYGLEGRLFYRFSRSASV